MRDSKHRRDLAPGWPCWPQGQKAIATPDGNGLGLFEEALAIPCVDRFPFDLARMFTSTEVVYGVTGTDVTVLPEYGVSP